MRHIVKKPPLNNGSGGGVGANRGRGNCSDPTRRLGLAEKSRIECYGDRPRFRVKR